MRGLDKNQRGASFVEFALGAIVFFLLLFGCIAISIYLATRIVVTRALDTALENLITDPRFIEDTQRLSGAAQTAAWARVNAARADAIAQGNRLVEASWVGNMLIPFTLTPPSGSSITSKIQVLRANSGTGAIGFGGGSSVSDTWSEVGGTRKVNYSYVSGNNCLATPSVSYAVVSLRCPLMAHALIEFTLWPFGKITLPITTYQFPELRDPPITPRSLPTLPLSGTPTLTHTPTATPGGAPPPPSPTGTPPPTPTSTPVPPPPDCIYYSTGDAEGACCIPLNCGHFSACYSQCNTTPVSFRCTGRCEGG